MCVANLFVIKMQWLPPFSMATDIFLYKASLPGIEQINNKYICLNKEKLATGTGIGLAYKKQSIGIGQ